MGVLPALRVGLEKHFESENEENRREKKRKSAATKEQNIMFIDGVVGELRLHTTWRTGTTA